jgi:hypothetical protein
MRRLQLVLANRSLAFGGAFSRDPRLNEAGYAQYLDEQVADFIGNQVFARLVAREPTLEGRRSWYWAALAELCEPPSWAREFPEEYAVEEHLVGDEHQPAAERRRVLIQKEGAALLECTPDLSLKNCSWEGPWETPLEKKLGSPRGQTPKPKGATPLRRVLPH